MLSLLVTLAMAQATAAQEPGARTQAPLTLAAAIELPGVEGRIDHLAFDGEHERVFVAALGNDTVEVVDLPALRVVRSLQAGEPQGILCLPERDCVVFTSGKAGTCEVYGTESLERVARVEVGDDADNLRYDARSQRVYVAWGSGALAVIDARSWKRVANIALSGHPESFQLDAEGKRAYVNVPGAHEVAVVDLETAKVVTAWRLDEAQQNYPMALIPADSSAPALLLVGCRAPAKLVARSLPGGDAVAALELSGDVDDLFWDARRRRVYCACGEGFVDVLERTESGFRPLAKVATAPGARTALFVPESNGLFVAVPHRDGQRAEVRIFDVKD
jgi:hypothetical protein